MSKFKVGDVVRGVDADIRGCEGRIEKIDEYGNMSIRLSKLGYQSWHDGSNPEWQIGKITRVIDWSASLELIDSSQRYCKHNVGDIVVVKDLEDKDYKDGSGHTLYFNSEMRAMAGKSVKIKKVDEKQGRYSIFEDHWLWCDEFFEDSQTQTTTQETLIKTEMGIDEIKGMDKSILEVANKEVLEEIANEEKLKAKKVLKELYLKKKALEDSAKINKEQLENVLKDLSIATKTKK